jgi:hypothetical protein
MFCALNFVEKVSIYKIVYPAKIFVSPCYTEAFRIFFLCMLVTMVVLINVKNNFENTCVLIVFCIFFQY